jgi:hypothetical protein
MAAASHHVVSRAAAIAIKVARTIKVGLSQATTRT